MPSLDGQELMPLVLALCPGSSEFVFRLSRGVADGQSLVVDRPT